MKPARARGSAGPAVRRRWVAGGAALAALLWFAASFLTWISTSTQDAGRTDIDGWGGITGSSSIAGTNLNDVLDGADTYRPGVITAMIAAVAVIVAISLAAVSIGPRPHRVTAAALTLCALVGLGWGLVRGFDPGDAGVFQPGDASAGAGPWVTALGGVVAAAAAVAIFAGWIDPRPGAARQRGIQPR